MFISEIKREEKEKEFLQKAKAVHHGKFDYSQVSYIDSRTPIIIICKEHGPFTQSPAKHLRSKYACMKCQVESKKTDYRSFVKQALKVHQGKYIYEPYMEKRKDEKVRIFCIEHNCYFEQEIRLHLKGHLGCKQCLHKSRQKNLWDRHVKEFIELFVKKFGSDFDFSKSEYINATTPILIKCLKHNKEFYQIRKNLTRAISCSCPECKKEARFMNNREKYEEYKKEFIKLFKQKFGSKFDFSKVKYINNTTPVLLKCLHHNIEFYQTRQNLIRYKVCSCPQCKKERRNKK